MIQTGLRLAIWSGEHLLAHFPGQPASTAMPELDAAPRPRERPAEESLCDAMDRLLDRALRQGTRESQSEFFRRVLSQLVADEARIVGALSDGRGSPLVNISARLPRNGGSPNALQHASLIGREANVALPHLVPRYITHLLALGLVEVAPEDTALKRDYELLLAEGMVMDAVKVASIGPVPARVERLTVRLSALGRDFWFATQGTGP